MEDLTFQLQSVHSPIKFPVSEKIRVLWDLKYPHLCWQYLFSITAITKHCKISGLKQYKYVILQFCRLRVQHTPHWVKIKVSRGLRSLALGKSGFLCLSQLLKATCSPGLASAFPQLQSQQQHIKSFPHCIPHLSASLFLF